MKTPPPEDQLVDRATLAGMLGVTEATVAFWEAQGMPSVAVDADVAPRVAWQPPADWKVGRVELARFLGLHADSVSRLVAQNAGLAAAVTRRGHKGEAIQFDLRKAMQWDLERRHPGLLAALQRDVEAAQHFVEQVLDLIPADVQFVRTAPVKSARRKRSKKPPHKEPHP